MASIARGTCLRIVFIILKGPYYLCSGFRVCGIEVGGQQCGEHCRGRADLNYDSPEKLQHSGLVQFHTALSQNEMVLVSSTNQDGMLSSRNVEKFNFNIKW